MMKKIVSVLFILMLVSALIGCGGGKGESGSVSDPAAMDQIQEGVHTALEEYLGADFPPENFADGKIPTNEVTRLKKGDADFDSYLQGIEIDPAVVEDYFMVRSMVMVKSDSIIVMRVNDMEKAEAELVKYHEGQIKKWESYLPAQNEKVKNNVTGSAGDYIYYVTSDAQAEVLEVIRGVLG